MVADLHLEKGSAFAQRGQLLPPYDTSATLDRLEEVIGRLQPATVICLGDSFHDSRAAERIAPRDAARLCRHDGGARLDLDHRQPRPGTARPPGRPRRRIRHAGAAVLPARGQRGAGGEVSGHYHPVAAIRVRGKRVRARCFASDGQRLIMPSFGAYTGGLNVLDRALAPLLGRRFEVRMMGRERLFAFPSARLEPDPERVAYQ